MRLVDRTTTITMLHDPTFKSAEDVNLDEKEVEHFAVQSDK